MRNPRQEKRAQLRKTYAKCRFKPNHGKMRVFHAYDEPAELSYWDDLSFRLGEQVVMVAWRHPRHAYAEAVSELAWAQVRDKAPEHESGWRWREDATEVVQRVGKSRKKVVAYRMGPLDDNWQAYFEKKREAEQQLLATSSVAVQAAMKVTLTSWCRYVELCYPMEVRNEQDLEVLMAKVKALLTGKASLPQGVLYRAEDWVAENRQGPSGTARSHAVRL